MFLAYVFLRKILSDVQSPCFNSFEVNIYQGIQGFQNGFTYRLHKFIQVNIVIARIVTARIGYSLKIPYPFARFSSRKSCYKSQLLRIHNISKQIASLQCRLIIITGTNKRACHSAHTTVRQLTAMLNIGSMLDHDCAFICVYCTVSIVLRHVVTF